MRLLSNRFSVSLQNKFWRLVSERAPAASEFAAADSEAFRSIYKGRAADLFFSNKQEPVHKWLHYLPIYDKAFSPYVASKIRFLEIGVSRGGSLKMWRQFFGSDAVIFGIDIDARCAAHDGKYAQVRIGSQADPAFLRGVVEDMGGLDVVLDDGSHHASDQRASFNVLFPLLSDGGAYVIEDLHTAYWPKSEGGLRRPGTAIEFLKEKIDVIHQHYYKKGLNAAAAMPDIESIQFFDSIAVIIKRKQLPRRHLAIPSDVDTTAVLR
jgi:cephalosporin hydroxylase